MLNRKNAQIVFGISLSIFLLPALCAHADSVVKSEQYRFSDSQVGDVMVKGIVLQVDTIKVDALAGQERKHFFITCSLQSNNPSTEQMVLDQLFSIYDKAGNLIEIVYANGVVLSRQQISPCATDNGDRVDTTVDPASMKVQLTISDVHHLDPVVLTPSP